MIHSLRPLCFVHSLRAGPGEGGGGGRGRAVEVMYVSVTEAAGVGVGGDEALVPSGAGRRGPRTHSSVGLPAAYLIGSAAVAIARVAGNCVRGRAQARGARQAIAPAGISA